MAAKLHDLDSAEAPASKRNGVSRLSGPLRGLAAQAQEMHEAFMVFDRDKSAEPAYTCSQQSRSWSVKAAGGKVTPSELKHVMNSLGEKAHTRADLIIAWGFFGAHRSVAGPGPPSRLRERFGGHKRGDRRDGQRGGPAVGPPCTWGARGRSRKQCEMRLTWTAMGNSASRTSCSLGTQGTREALWRSAEKL